MAQFVFTVLDAKGTRTSGTLESSDRKTALKNLSDQDLTVVALTQMKAKKESMRVRGEELYLFTHELGSMVKAGIMLSKALNVLASDMESPALRQISLELDSGINSGKSLSECLRQYPRVFDNFYVSMVEAGEGSGELALLLTRLAGYIEQAESMKGRLVGQLYYPAVTLIFAAVVMAFILAYGLPIVIGIYSGLDMELPFLTRIILGAGKFVQHTWFWLLLVLAGLIYAAKRHLATEKGRLQFDKMQLELKILGPLIRKITVARFARTLGTLYSAGVPILQAMELTAGSMGNKVMENSLRESVSNLSEGDSITQALSRTGHFTPLAVSMMSAGEETGTLDVMLKELATFYESQVEISLKALMSLVEPLIMIVVGVFIAIIILALAMPFMQLFTVIGK